MKLILAMMAVVILSGCAGLGGSSNMSADQLKAVAGDKNAGVFCSKGIGAGWTVDNMFVSFDKSVVSNGGLTAKCGEYSVGITTEWKPNTPPTPASVLIPPLVVKP